MIVRLDKTIYKNLPYETVSSSSNSGDTEPIVPHPRPRPPRGLCSPGPADAASASFALDDLTDVDDVSESSEDRSRLYQRHVDEAQRAKRRAGDKYYQHC
jgi:hypothetical protein